MSSFAALRNDNARLLKENASLRQRCRQQAQEPSELNEAKECVVSVAFDDTNGRRDTRNKYKAALQTFLHPLHTKYQITTECLSSPQPCKFLLWVTFVGGRLPDHLPRFAEFAAQAGNATTA